jgi:DNA-directed RNA polymerase subunit beta
MVEFVIRQEMSAIVGDKLNNRFFNKGVISVIEETEDMPYIEELGIYVDMIYNPLSVINRMNTGQILEMHTGLISWKLAKLVEEKQRKEFEKIVESVYSLLDNTEGKAYSKRIISTIKSLSDSAYSKFRQNAINDKFIPIIIPPFKSPSNDNIMKCMRLLGLKTTYPVRLKKFGNILTKPVAVGMIYVLRLEHIAEKKLSSRGIGSYVQKTGAPTGGATGHAAYIGEYDLYSLMTYDANYVIDEFFGALSSDHITKNEMITEIVNTGTTSFRPAKVNPIQDLFNQMLHAIHLEYK